MPHFFRVPCAIIFFVFTLPNFLLAKTAPLHVAHKKSPLPIGIWRGEIVRPDGKSIVFNFETKIRSGKMVIYVMNGSERLLVHEVEKKADSVYIHMPFYDSYFALRLVNAKNLQGEWIKNYGDHLVTMPFFAAFNVRLRFPVFHTPAFNITGRWSVHFRGTKDSTESVGEFKQKGSYVTGTFLTVTGDYRYLIIGFPTTIFIGKKGTVRKIETGFNGPGTGEHYAEYKKMFNELINTLVNE